MYNVLLAIQKHAQNQPNKTALICDGQVINFIELERYISGTMENLKGIPSCIGLQAPNSLAWVITDLALLAMGRIIVPLPTFFSAKQTAHIIKDADIGLVIRNPEITQIDGGFTLESGAQKIIYTSGTTGTPKGVVHGAEQINFMVHALIKTAQVTTNDKHLSVLPFSLLLEQISGLYAPLTVGFPSIIDVESAEGLIQGKLGALIQNIQKYTPTTSVLVPQQLSFLLKSLKGGKDKMPKTLRFIAVGGAHISEQMVDEAWNLGIPVFEGYGLSECCSVVAVNTLEIRKTGTVGKALDGVSIHIENDEIIVTSPSVMQSYLNGVTVQNKTWKTGDLGAIDDDGYLKIYGRKDNVLVTSNGRNISPEWIESMFTSSPMISHAVLLGCGRDFPVIVISLDDDFSCLEKLDDLIEELIMSAPNYAKPKEWLVFPKSRFNGKTRQELTQEFLPHIEHFYHNFSYNKGA